MLRENLEKLLCFFNNLPSDSTFERIRANRLAVTQFIGLFVIQGNPNSPLNILIGEIEVLMYSWCHYFDEGYTGNPTIDELPDLIKEKIKEVLSIL